MKKLLLPLLFPVFCMAQPTYFEKVFGSEGNDVSRSVKQIASGSIFVLGSTDSSLFGGTDITLSKLDIHGNETDRTYYGSVLNENGFYLNTTADGNLVFAAEQEMGPSDLDIKIYKVDTLGNLIWMYTYSTPVNETVRYIEQTSDGGYILCGSQNDAGGLFDILVLKLDAGGNYQWHQTFGRTDNEYSDMIHEISTGYILTADTKSYGAGGYDVILYELDTSGIEVWSQTYGDSVQNGCQGLLILSDGNYLSYGETEIFPASPFQFYLEKIGPSGNSIWRKTFGGPGADAIFSVREDTDGGFVCTGYSNSYNGGAPLDLVFLKTDSGGNFLWEQTYGGTGVDIGYELIKANDNSGFIVTGKIDSVANDYYVLKLDNFGMMSGITAISSETNDFDVFPNPSNGLVTLSYRFGDRDGKGQIICRNLLGEEVFILSLNPPDGKQVVDLRNLCSGIYSCTLLVNNVAVSTKKIVITGK